MDPVGFEEYTETTKYRFKCRLHGFANSKIRVFYKINETYGATEGEFSNDSKTGLGKKSLNYTEKQTVTFRRSISAYH